MNLTRRSLFALAALSLLVLSVGCSERDPAGLEVARANIDPVVFDDDYGTDVYFQAFSGTHINAVSLDSVYAYNSLTSFKITVPPEGSALGAYAGGVLTSVAGRDQADFNALTFYARSNVNSALNVAGFGNDNTGLSLYEAGRLNIPLTPEWTFVVIPIPSPGKLISERGLFTFAEGWEDLHPLGHEVWIDRITFANLGNISNPRPVMTSTNKQYFIGSVANLDGTFTTFDIDGADVVVEHMPGYFDFQSSNPAVAIEDRGVVRIVGEGDAVVTATLDGVAVDGSVTLSGFLPPTAAATPPTAPAQDVVSLFSDVYHDVPVDSWNTHWQWSTAQDEDYVVAGSNTKMYSTLNFVGIEFKNPTVNAGDKTHFHIDVYAPVGTNFKIKFVAFPPDLTYGRSSLELTFDATSVPAFNSGSWVSLDIPLEDFELPVSWDSIGELVISTDDAQLVLVDNIYWH